MACSLMVEGVEQDTSVRNVFSLSFKAYDAPIDVDAILSYEWLARQGVVVHPRRHGIVIERDNTSFWVAGMWGLHGEERGRRA